MGVSKKFLILDKLKETRNSILISLCIHTLGLIICTGFLIAFMTFVIDYRKDWGSLLTTFVACVVALVFELLLARVMTSAVDRVDQEMWKLKHYLEIATTQYEDYGYAVFHSNENMKPSCKSTTKKHEEFLDDILEDNHIPHID